MSPQSPGQTLSRFPEECFQREKGKAPETGFESQGRFFMMSFPARTEVLTLVSAVAAQEGVKTGCLAFIMLLGDSEPGAREW